MQVYQYGFATYLQPIIAKLGACEKQERIPFSAHKVKDSAAIGEDFPREIRAARRKPLKFGRRQELSFKPGYGKPIISAITYTFDDASEQITRLNNVPS